MNVFVFLEYRVSMVFLLLFLYYFQVQRYTRSKTILILLSAFIITSGMDVYAILIDDRQSIQNYSIILQIFVAQITAFVMSDHHDFRAIFTGMSAAVYVLNGNIAANFLFVYSGSIAIALVVQILIHSLLLYGLRQWIGTAYITEMKERNTGWGTVCIIPALFYAIAAFLSMWPSNLYDYPKTGPALVCVLALIIVTYVALFRFLARERTANELVSNNQFLMNYTAHLKREMQQQKANELQTAIIRHDSRHRIAVLLSYLDKNEVEKARNLLQTEEQQMEEQTIQRFCANGAVDSVVSRCSHLARQSQVLLKTDIRLPADLNINEYEFAMVVSNLLENAVQAAAVVENEKDRRVWMKAVMHKEQTVLEIVNTFNGVCSYDRTTGMPVSEKGRGHGFGMRSVLAFTQKYNAVFDYSIEDGRFVARLLV